MHEPAVHIACTMPEDQRRGRAPFRKLAMQTCEKLDTIFPQKGEREDGVCSSQPLLFLFFSLFLDP